MRPNFRDAKQAEAEIDNKKLCLNKSSYHGKTEFSNGFYVVYLKMNESSQVVMSAHEYADDLK